MHLSSLQNDRGFKILEKDMLGRVRKFSYWRGIFIFRILGGSGNFEEKWSKSTILNHTKIFSFSFIFQVLQTSMEFQYCISNILINIVSSFKRWSLFWKNTSVLARLVVVYYRYICQWYNNIWPELYFGDFWEER